MFQFFEEQIIIEKLLNYFVDWNIFSRVKLMNFLIKFLLIVKDLFYRVVFDYVQIKENRIDKNMEMEEFEDLVIDFMIGNVKINYKVINRFLYYIYIKRWLKYFFLEQIYIVDGDNLVLYLFEELEKVEIFLGLRYYI